MQFSIELPVDVNRDAAVAQLCNRCFVSVVGELVTYLDRMIAFKRLRSRQLSVPAGVSTRDEVLQLIQRLLDEEYAAVARDTRLSNPKKLAEFPGIVCHFSKPFPQRILTTIPPPRRAGGRFLFTASGALRASPFRVEGDGGTTTAGAREP